VSRIFGGGIPVIGWAWGRYRAAVSPYIGRINVDKKLDSSRYYVLKKAAAFVSIGNGIGSASIRGWTEKKGE